jgi:hypothetical protein
MLTVSSPLSSQLSWQRERLRQRCCFLHACIGARPYGTLQSKRYRTWQPLTAIVAAPSVIPAVKFPCSPVPFPASKNVPPEFVLLLKACIGTRARCFATTKQVIQRDSLQPPLLSTCWHIFRPEWTGPHDCTNWPFCP